MEIRKNCCSRIMTRQGRGMGMPGREMGMDGMEMILLAGLAADAVLAAAGLAKRRGKLWFLRFTAFSVIVNLTAFYLSAGLTAEFGKAAFLTAACAAAAKIFVSLVFIQRDKLSEEMPPVYLLCIAVSLCIHSDPAAGLACELALLIFCLYSEHLGRERQRQREESLEWEEGIEKSGSQRLYLQAIEDSYRKNRALMHDLNNHAIAMQALAAHGEYGELAQYIDIFSRKVKDNMFPVRSGNIVLDALLADKYHRAAGLEIPVLFEGVRYSAHIHNEDLCTVVGNLLDNAIEENRKCREPGQRRISVYISSKEDSLRITVENPLFHELKVKNGLPVSEKPDAEHHGMGLKNVRRVCDKYGGTLVWDASEDRFMVTAELFTD